MVGTAQRCGVLLVHTQVGEYSGHGTKLLCPTLTITSSRARRRAVSRQHDSLSVCTTVTPQVESCVSGSLSIHTQECASSSLGKGQIALRQRSGGDNAQPGTDTNVHDACDIHPD